MIFCETEVELLRAGSYIPEMQRYILHAVMVNDCGVSFVIRWFSIKTMLTKPARVLYIPNYIVLKIVVLYVITQQSVLHQQPCEYVGFFMLSDRHPQEACSKKSTGFHFDAWLNAKSVAFLTKCHHLILLITYIIQLSKIITNITRSTHISSNSLFHTLIVNSLLPIRCFCFKAKLEIIVIIIE